MHTDFDINFQECLSPLCSYIMETEGYVTVHSALPSNHSTDLMISIKSVCNNFESMSGNAKKLLLYDEFRLD